jgi:hypothetical protein
MIIASIGLVRGRQPFEKGKEVAPESCCLAPSCERNGENACVASRAKHVASTSVATASARPTSVYNHQSRLCETRPAIWLQRPSNMPHFPSASQATDGQESDVARTVRIRVKTRRRRYLEQNGDYFDSPSLELAGAAAWHVYD